MQTVGSLRFDEIGEDEVYTLIDALDGVCERTRKTYITTFGRLCAFVTGTNPVNRAQVIWGDCEPTHRIFIDSEDWPRIKDAARSSTDRLILYLGAYMGLRREEMVRIKMQDIDGDYLMIHGKGHGQDGSVVRKQMPQPVRTALRVYLGQRQELHPETDQLLIRIDGRQPGRIMDGRSIRFAVDKMVERSGVKFTPHSLRRLYATTMWEATGKDLVLTKTATRHASADVLMDCYINANPAGEREAVDRMLQMIRRASH
jgi:integrase